MKSAWEGVKDFFGGIWDAITGKSSDSSGNVNTDVSSNFEQAAQNTQQSWNAAQQAVETSASGMETSANTSLQNIRTSFTTTVTGVNQMATRIQAASTRIQTALTQLQTKFTASGVAIVATVTLTGTTVTATTTAAMATTMAVVTAGLAAINAAFIASGGAIRSSAASTAAGITSAFSSAMANARSSVASGLAAIQGMFAGIHLSLPHVAVPHFSVSGTLSLNPPQVPSISVSYYKNGGILNGPTLFDLQGNHAKVGGEAGAEAVTPLAELWKNMKQIVGDTFVEKMSSVRKLLQNSEEVGNMKTAYAYYGGQQAQTVEAPQVNSSGNGQKETVNNIHVTNSPTVVVNGDKPGDLEQKLEENNESLIRRIFREIRERDDDNDRTVYD